MRRALSPQVKRFALDFMRAIGTPLASKISTWIHQGEWDSIAQCKVDPRAYTSAQEYFLDASAASLLRKYKDLPTSLDRYGAAVANWKAGEVDCFRTNERLNPYLEGLTHPSCREDVHAHFCALREKIRVLLGRAPSMDDLNPRFGPGATFSDPSVRSTIADKMENRASLTSGAKWFLLDWMGTAWGREAPSPEGCVWVRGNRFTTAPKDATKDRPIAAEPSVNIFYQLGVGQAIRRALKRAGIDLDEGQAIHRLRACEASISGLSATLDLKNASDTVAYNLVRLLLPPDWFRLVDELRSPFTRFSKRDASTVLGREPSQVGDHWVRLEKFSSMGNGFTFELESLIFWALADYASAQSAGPDRQKTLVYGDDIICDSRSVDAVIALLKFCGFTTNSEKSFVGGTFRESCGGDFWTGRPVRPFFLKDSLDEPQQLIAAANQVRRLALDLFGGLGPLARTWFALQDQLPSGIRRCRGPEGLGDIVIHDREDTWSWTSRAHDRILAYRPVKHRRVRLGLFSPGVVLAFGLYTSRAGEGFINPRDSVTGYAVRKVVPYGVDWLPQVHIAPQPRTPMPLSWGGLGTAARVIRAAVGVRSHMSDAMR